MRYVIASCVALVAALGASAIAQDATKHAYGATDGLTVEVQTLPSRVGPFPHAVRFTGEPASVLNFTDEIAMEDTVFLGNARADIVPGSKHPVAVFQLMPEQGVEYSATMARLCGGLKGIPILGIENGRSIRKHGFNEGAPVRIYVFEETFSPGKIHLRLCKAIDLAAG